MSDEDARDAEHDLHVSMAKGQCHEVTLDVTVRITVDALGRTHLTDDLEDMVTAEAIYAGDIQSIEEVF